ncbi:heme-degrading domain-containing protein [Photobacterium minamisatsumaniensis]|uniref:heme-degrading domain-containing protein n=1 Tax=Photobacterium minamisatsumaniensis TaxID=2910233 RepID=UPI003D0CD491
MSSEHLTHLLAQETELQFAYFNNEAAWKLGYAIKQATEKISASVAIEIYAFEQVLFSYAMPETNKDHQDWVRRKRQSVLRYGHSSYYLGQYNASKLREFESQVHIDVREYCAHGGSFPIRIKGSGLVGAITVSGLPQVDDHILVINTLREYFAPSMS